MNKGAFASEIKVFRAKKSPMRLAEAVRSGISPRALYAMQAEGVLERVDRGLYRLANQPLFPHQDLLSVTVRARKGVICLISALAFHDITTQVPHEVQIALPFGAEKPRISYPPTRCFWFKGAAYGEGIERKIVDGVAVIRIYSPEKTVADCFKFRNKLGLDVAIEALKLCLERKRSKPAELLKYARICRVERVMTPYLQALL